MESWILPLFGGVIIGLATTTLLYFNGKITGISGILGSSLKKPTPEIYWKYTFIFGLISGSLIFSFFYPQFFNYEIPMGMTAAVIGGLFVGYGTRLGSGCTSGHGVCGISRFSKRSLVATLTFMISGMIAVAVVKLF
jgi:uncharacterized membrane protein YedE/YeeE